MKTNTLNSEAIAYIKKETEGVVEQLVKQDNADIKIILKEIYLTELPDKTEEQAILMSDAILEAVYSFNKDFETAMEDPDGWIDSFLANRLNGKTLEEQYDLAFRLLMVLTLMQEQAVDCEFAKYDITVDEFINKMEDGKISKENLTEKDVEDIVAKIKELSRCSAVIFNGCEETAELLESQMDVNEIFRHTMKICEDIEYRAVASMIGYVGCKNGNIKGIPADMSAKQIVYEVCAGIEAAEVVKKAANGEMAWDVAKTILKVLANIVLLYAAFKFIMLGAAIGGILIGSTFGILIGAGLITWIFFNFSDAYDKFIDKGLEITKTAAVFTFDKFKKGLNTLKGWLYETVIPATAGLVKSIVKFIKEKATNGLTVIKEAVNTKQKVSE